MQTKLGQTVETLEAVRQWGATQQESGQTVQQVIEGALAWQAQALSADQTTIATLAAWLGAACEGYCEARTIELSEQARRDALTQLGNRLAFDEQCGAELRRAARYQHELTLVLLDCDGFKQINDTRGHLAGDALLQALAAWLQKSLRQTDAAFRFGGDEFAVLLPETSAAQTEHAMHRLQEDAATKLPLQFSWGHATFPADVAEQASPTIADAQLHLLACADQRLYQQKRAARRAPTS